MTFTAGKFASGICGFRVYGVSGMAMEQATLLWDENGCLVAVVAGDLLGRVRTGALGGVAADVLAWPNATDVGVVGSGAQAWSQMWALTAVRQIRSLRVFSPSPSHRADFARRARQELSLDGTDVASPKDAAEGADVVLATRSAIPVIDATWVAEGCHVTTVGPKTVSAHETPTALVDRAAVVVSDSPEQAGAYEEPCFTDTELVHLGAFASGRVPSRKSASDITLYLSTGLAGSEVAVAAAVVEHAWTHRER